MLLLPTVATAEWMSLEGNEELEVYVDPGTRIREGDTVRIMALFNYRKPGYAHGKRYVSSLMQDEYDCVQEKRRRLYLSAHTEPKAQGKTILRNRAAGDWKPITPETVGERLWKTACNTQQDDDPDEQLVGSTKASTGGSPSNQQ